jgi:hypothetical protein
MACTRWTSRRGNSSKTYEADKTSDDGVKGAPKESNVDSGVGLGGRFLYSAIRNASSGELGGGVRDD